MARMSLDTAIRLSAEVKGGANITKVQREIQNLAKDSKLTAQEMGTMRVAALQLAKANDGTVAGLRSSIAALRGLKDQAKIGGQEFRAFGADIQRLEAKLKGLDGTAKAAGRSLSLRDAAASAAGTVAMGGGPMAAIGAAGGSLAAAGGAAGVAAAGTLALGGALAAQSVTSARALEDQSRRLRVMTDDSAALQSGVIALVREQGYLASTTEATAAAYDILQAGFAGTDDILKIVKASTLGAVGGFTDLVTVSDALTSILNGYNRSAGDAGKIVDQIKVATDDGKISMEAYAQSIGRVVPSAAAAKLPLEQINAAISALTAQGVPVETTFSGINQAIKTILKPTEEAKGLAKALGLQFNAQALATKGLGGFLADVAQKTGKSTDALSILFSDIDGYKAVVALLNDDLKRFNQFSENQEKALGRSADAAGKAVDPLKRFDNSWKDLTSTIGKSVLPMITSAVDALTAAISVIQSLPDPIKDVGGRALAAGLLIGGLALALKAISGASAAVAALKAYTASTVVAGDASAVAAGKTRALGASLASIARIGIIVAGVDIVINGLGKLKEVQQRLDAIRNSGTQDFGAQIGGSALPRTDFDRLIKENRAEYQRRKKEFESVRFPNLTGQDEIAKAAMLQLDTRLAKLESMRNAAPRAGTPATQTAAQRSAAAAAATAAATGLGNDGAGAGSSTAKVKPESIGAQVAKSLQQALDLTPAQAAGVVGNLMRESGLNPRVNEGGAVGAPRGVGGYGLAQWTGSRQKDLIRFAGGAAGAGNLQTQLRFMVSELMGPESKALASLRKTTTPEEAAVVFDRDYERSGIKALPERKANARRVYGEIAGSSPGAGLDDFAGQLKSQAQAAETMREQQQAAKGLLDTESNRLKLLQISDPLQKQVAESMIKQLTVMDEYGKRLLEAKSDEERKALQQAKQTALQANALDLERSLTDAREEALKPLNDAVKETGDRLAYEREYGGLLEKGINPELAKQYIEIDRIAEASKTALELQIAKLEAMAAELPIADELRKKLEDQVRLARELLGLIPGAATGAKGDAKEEDEAKRKREKDQTEAEAKAERLKNLYQGINSTIEEGIVGSMQAGIDSLIDGTKRLDEALKEILSGVIKDIANQLLRFAINTGLKAIGGKDGGLFSFAGGGYTGSSPRAGGIDGQGGFPAILHPQETVIDHTRMMPVPYQKGAGAAATSEQIVPYQASAAAASNGLTVPFQSGGTALAVPFLKGGGTGAVGDGMAASIDVKFETVRIGEMDFVTRDEAQRIGRESAQRGAELASKRYRNNPDARRRDGIR